MTKDLILTNIIVCYDAIALALESLRDQSKTF